MKRIFYNKRRKIPNWSQVYLVWFIIAAICSIWIGFAEKVDFKNDFKQTYNFKKEYNAISSIHLKILNAYPNTNDYNPDILRKVNNDLVKYKWRIEETETTFHKLNCKVKRYYRDNEKPDLMVLIDNEPVINSFYFLHTLASIVIDQNLQNLTIVSIEGGAVCTGYGLDKIQKNSAPNMRYLHITKGAINEAQIHLVNSAGGFSSILWAAIIPESIKRPSIGQQIVHAAIPVFQKFNFYKEKSIWNGITWIFPNDLKSNVNAIHTILPPLIFTLRNYSEISSKTTNNIFWIGEKKALTHRAGVIIACLLVLLIWLPLANKLYAGESIRHLVKGFFAGLYGSIPLFLFALIIKAQSYFLPESVSLVLTAFILIFLLHLFLSKIQKSLFDLNVNPVTHFVWIIVLASIIPFSNLSLFIFMIPVVFAASKKKENGNSLFPLLIILSTIPLIYALYIAGSLLGNQELLNHFSAIWLEQTIFNNISFNALYFLLIGSILVNSRNSK